MDIFEIHFIPGKGISTKSIHDGVISAHFEVPMNFNSQKFVNKVIALHIKDDKGTDIEFDCNLSSDGNSYYYSATHKNYCVKLDILVQDILAIGFILRPESKLSLSLPTETD